MDAVGKHPRRAAGGADAVGPGDGPRGDPPRGRPRRPARLVHGQAHAHLAAARGRDPAPSLRLDPGAAGPAGAGSGPAPSRRRPPKSRRSRSPSRRLPKPSKKAVLLPAKEDKKKPTPPPVSRPGRAATPAVSLPTSEDETPGTSVGAAPRRRRLGRHRGLQDRPGRLQVPDLHRADGRDHEPQLVQARPGRADQPRRPLPDRARRNDHRPAAGGLERTPVRRPGGPARGDRLLASSARCPPNTPGRISAYRSFSNDPGVTDGPTLRCSRPGARRRRAPPLRPGAGAHTGSRRGHPDHDQGRGGPPARRSPFRRSSRPGRPGSRTRSPSPSRRRCARTSSTPAPSPSPSRRSIRPATATRRRRRRPTAGSAPAPRS